MALNHTSKGTRLRYTLRSAWNPVFEELHQIKIRLLLDFQGVVRPRGVCTRQGSSSPSRLSRQLCCPSRGQNQGLDACHGNSNISIVPPIFVIWIELLIPFILCERVWVSIEGRLPLNDSAMHVVSGLQGLPDCHVQLIANSSEICLGNSNLGGLVPGKHRGIYNLAGGDPRPSTKQFNAADHR
jgi:hypothetical protein